MVRIFDEGNNFQKEGGLDQFVRKKKLFSPKKNIMKYLISFLFTGLILFGCGNVDKPSTAKTTPPAPVTAPPATIDLPAPPPEFAMNLFENCDYVDIIMFQSNFSMNISQQGSIQMTIKGLTTEPQSNFANCPAQGRLFFLNKGQSMTEADLHFTDGVCHAMVFYVDGKKKYSSKLGQQGINMFGSYFKNANQIQQNAQGGQ